MRVLKITDLPEQPMGTATPIDGWTGGAVSRTRQAVIGAGQSDHEGRAMPAATSTMETSHSFQKGIQ